MGMETNSIDIAKTIIIGEMRLVAVSFHFHSYDF
jgi:hypothetical protein